MPSASSILFIFASLLGAATARVVPDACPASCSDVTAYGIEHHRLQDLSHCTKKLRYNEVVRVSGDELIPEVSVCSEGEAVPLEAKRQENRNAPTQQLIDFHVFSKTDGIPLEPWAVSHLAEMIAADAPNADIPPSAPWWVTTRISPGNITMGVFAGRDVDPKSLSDAISGWGKQFVKGTSTFAAQYCGMSQDKSIGFVFDGSGIENGVVEEYMNLWDVDKCVFDWEKAHVWSDVKVTYRNDVWKAVADTGYRA